MFKLFLAGTSRSKQLKHLVLGGLLVGSIMLIMVGVAEAGVGRDVKRANKLYQEEKYDEALGLYDKALEKEPNDQVIQYNRAAALYRKNEFAKSAEAFLRSLAGVDESIE
ncbi:MAG: tetratricopeptide repeat protein, partial [Candidatus Omnitrophota bacterium]